MPREPTAPVRDFPPLKQGVLYPVLVTGIDNSDGCLHVVIEHLDGDQAGREHVLNQPIRPSGRPAELLRSCGLEVSPDKRIPFKRALGAEIGARFRQGPSGWTVARFERISSNEH